jgi:LysR family transcriptional regulator, hydrogen peroxide-inducible genes activator
MTLIELRYIVALQQTGHFGKAAEKCHVSQPTLSVAIKKLEEELDIAIFERSRNQVRPTPLGLQIIEQAQKVLEQAGLIHELADTGKDPLGSTLAIGAIFTVGPYLFPHFVPQLQTTAPHMPLYIEENYTAELRKKLRIGELDAIIIALPFTEPDVVTQALYEEPFVVLLPHNHPLTTHKKITARQLEQEQVLLLGSGHCFRDQVLDACPGLKKNFSKNQGSKNSGNSHNNNDALQSVVEGSSLETLKYMVASGLGITILPESAAQLARYDSNVLTTRPFGDSRSKRTVALAWRASFPRPQAIEVLSQAIRHNRLESSRPELRPTEASPTE